MILVGEQWIHQKDKYYDENDVDDANDDDEVILLLLPFFCSDFS